MAKLYPPKDSNGAYVKPEPLESPPPTPEPNSKDISYEELVDKSTLILYRETRQLLLESSKGKLCKDSAQCLRDNLKLLLELQEIERKALKGMTDEEIEALERKKTR